MSIDFNDEPELKIYIEPRFAEVDTGEGGIRRVVEAQRKYLPQMGIHVVDRIEDADVCVYHGGNWRGTDKPVVSHCHGLYWNEYEWGNWAHDLNKHVVDAMRKSDVVTAPSKWIAHILQRGMMIDPPVLYHGVDVDEWKPLEAEARLAPNGETIKPYVLWNKTRVDAICTPVPLNKLAEMAPDTNFVTTFGEDAPNVIRTGKLPIEQAKQLIERASVYLCTTRETFGIGTLEAMACGIPVLGFRWGGQVEIVEHGVSGYLAAPGDYADLRRGLDFCLSNRDALGAAARQAVIAKFTWQLAMESYATVYRQLLRRSNKEARAPKVSVVITCYNLSNTLARAVESVDNQEDWDKNDTEIIIVNDNSPDDTATVADIIQATRSNVKVVTNENNLYLAGSLNVGIAASNGHYVIPLDADNELGPRALSVLATALDKDRSIDIAYGAMQVIDESGAKAPFVSGWPGEFNFADQMRHRNQLPSSSMFRRRVWDRSGGYRRRCRTAEDADFWTRVTSFGSVPRRISDAVTLIYHDRSDSMSHIERDWDWTAWYGWSRNLKLAPFAAAQNGNIRLSVSTYEPSLVTVVIPVGPGHSDYLIDAIDSLVAQTYQNWRCIVVNDSGKPLGWLPPFVKVLETGGGLGPSAARNMGINASNTHLFLPLDADDYLQPDALDILIATWRDQPNKTYVYADFMVAETGEVKPCVEFSCEALQRQAIHSVTALYPKAAWTEIGGFDESLNSWEDWDFVISIANQGYCGVRVPHPLLYYRLGAGSRRESMYADRTTMYANLSDKWRNFLVEKDTMGCGCGGGTSNRRQSAQVNSSSGVASPTGVAGDSMVLLEFKGFGGARSYRGQSTGQVYRFGADPEHKIGYVHGKDAESLLRLRDFKIADTAQHIVVSTVRLEAKGPPVAEAELANAAG